MHSRLDVMLCGVDEPEADRIMDGICRMTWELEARLNRFDPRSDVSNINTGSGAFDADSELYDIFKDAERYNLLTRGAFDIAIQTPDFESRNIYFSLDPERQAIVKEVPEAVFDFGGYAKGYVLELVRKMLLQEGLTDALVSFGGSSVLAIGSRPGREGWEIGIATPSDVHDNSADPQPASSPEMPLATVTLRNEALSASGNDGRNDGHILSPFTNHEITGRRIIAVTAPSPLDCEVLSTALFAAEEEQRETILAGFTTGQILYLEY